MASLRKLGIALGVLALVLAVGASQSQAGTCSGGAKDGQRCDFDQGCPHACVGGGRDGLSCEKDKHCKRGCDGGTRDGKVCKHDLQCPDACDGGDNHGKPCMNWMDCDGGTCVTASCEFSEGCTNRGRCVASPSGAFLGLTSSLL